MKRKRIGTDRKATKFPSSDSAESITNGFEIFFAGRSEECKDIVMLSLPIAMSNEIAGDQCVRTPADSPATSVKIGMN